MSGVASTSTLLLLVRQQQETVCSVGGGAGDSYRKSIDKSSGRDAYRPAVCIYIHVWD